MSQDEIKKYFSIMCAFFVPGHISGISDACSGQDVRRCPVHIPPAEPVTLILRKNGTAHSVTFSNQVAVHVKFFFAIKITTCFWSCDLSK